MFVWIQSYREKLLPGIGFTWLSGLICYDRESLFILFVFLKCLLLGTLLFKYFTQCLFLFQEWELYEGNTFSMSGDIIYVPFGTYPNFPSRKSPVFSAHVFPRKQMLPQASVFFLHIYCFILKYLTSKDCVCSRCSVQCDDLIDICIV
jgi:hypothetical protein